jgi:hypothetical protein
VSRTVTVVRVPAGSRLRPDAPLNQLRLAVARALIAGIRDATAWRELAMLTSSTAAIGQRGLFQERGFHDAEYVADVHAVVDQVLGVRHVLTIVGLDPEPSTRTVDVEHLVVLEEHLDLPSWLAEHEPRLHRVLYGADPAATAVLDAVDGAATDLDLPEIVRQLERLRRDLADDLPAAIGHAKELVESACKTVLSQTGPGAGTMKFPALVTAALQATGRHPTQIDPADPDAELLRRLLGGLSSQLEVIAGLRNRAGTGHGRAGEVPLDAPLARLVITQALAAVTYLLQVYDLYATRGGAPGGPLVAAGSGT